MSMQSKYATAGDFLLGTSVALGVLGTLFGFVMFSEDIVLAVF